MATHAVVRVTQALASTAETWVLGGAGGPQDAQELERSSEERAESSGGCGWLWLRGRPPSPTYPGARPPNLEPWEETVQTPFVFLNRCVLAADQRGPEAGHWGQTHGRVGGMGPRGLRSLGVVTEEGALS